MISINDINEYLSLHLQSDFWNELHVNKKNAAFKMAVDDVCGYLGISEIDKDRIFQLCAVGEQTIFLAEHYDSVTSAHQIKTEKIDGVGSREYVHNSSSLFSPRALTFLQREAALRNSFVSKISRG